MAIPIIIDEPLQKM